MKKSRITTVKGFIGAIEKLLVDKGWTQGAGARKQNGALTEFHNPKAARYCVTGAACVVRDTIGGKEGDALMWEARHAIESTLRQRRLAPRIVSFNDTRGRKKSEVLALLRDARKAA